MEAVLVLNSPPVHIYTKEEQTRLRSRMVNGSLGRCNFCNSEWDYVGVEIHKKACPCQLNK